MVSAKTYGRFVRAGAVYDIVSTTPLLAPWTQKLLLDLMAALNASLGLAGRVPAYDPLLAVFGNLLASIVLMWAILRLRSPEIRFGRYDAVCRVLYAIWMGVALLGGFSSLLYLYLIPEIALGLAQALPVRNEDARAG
jgi:hypothetical protein